MRELHPLLKAPPAVSEWAIRQAEIDAASEVDREAARRSRDEAARRTEQEYDNDRTTWMAAAVVVVIAIAGLFLVFRLIEKSRLEDCLLAHRYDCASLLDR